MTSLMRPEGRTGSAQESGADLAADWYRERGEIGARYWDGAAWWTGQQIKEAHHRWATKHVKINLVLLAVVFVLAELVGNIPR